MSLFVCLSVSVCVWNTDVNSVILCLAVHQTSKTWLRVCSSLSVCLPQPVCSTLSICLDKPVALCNSLDMQGFADIVFLSVWQLILSWRKLFLMTCKALLTLCSCLSGSYSLLKRAFLDDTQGFANIVFLSVWQLILSWRKLFLTTRRLCWQCVLVCLAADPLLKKAFLDRNNLENFWPVPTALSCEKSQRRLFSSSCLPTSLITILPVILNPPTTAQKQPFLK